MNLLKVAVCHHDKAQRQSVTETIMMGLKNTRLQCRLYSIRNTEEFVEALQQEQYHFDVICLDTAEAGCAQKILEREEAGCEYILLDTPDNMLAEYMQYKPAARIRTEEKSPEKAREALKVCLRYLSRKERWFCIQTKMKSLRIPYRKILFLESRQHQVVVHTVDQKEFCAFAATLDAVEQVLSQEDFLRCHQSFLVNLSAAEELDRSNRKLVLSSGDRIDVSKRYYKGINDFFSKESIL